jgi:hypothetical protein
MSKSRIARAAGFTVAAGATATLVGFAATGTGAYFSAAANGNTSVSTGSVSLATGDISNLDFTNLLPGNFKTNQISYRATGTGPEDIYLAFDDPNGDAPLNALNSPPNGPNAPSPLGRYGHLEVDGSQGNFQSYNLATNPSASAPGGTVAGDCNINADTGLGGSSDQAERSPAANPGTGSLSQVNYCPAPQYILLSKNLQAGDGLQSANITFGFTKVLDNNLQQLSDTSHIPFRIVAEQAGVLPSNPDTTNGH